MEPGGESEMNGESNMETYFTMCKPDSQWEFAVWLRELKKELCSNLESGGGVGREMGERFKSEDTYVYLWVIHVDVWQKPTNTAKQLSFIKK